MERRCRTKCLLIAWLLIAMPAISVCHADEAAKVFESLFGEKMKKVQATPQSDDDLALVRDLLNTVATVKTETALVNVICTKAFELASRRPTGFYLASEALGLLYKNVPERRRFALEQGIAVGKKLYARGSAAERKHGSRALVSNMQLLAELQDDAGEHKACLVTLREAKQYAFAAKLDNAEEVSREYEQSQARYKLTLRRSKLQEDLLRDANNTTAAKELAMMYMVDFNRPAEALKYVGRADDAKLASLFKAANKSRGEQTGEEMLAVADWYRAKINQRVGNVRLLMIQRAVDGYMSYLERFKKPGLRRVQAELSMKEIKKELTPRELAYFSNKGAAIRQGSAKQPVPVRPTPGPTTNGNPNGYSKVTVVEQIKGGQNAKWIELLDWIDPKKFGRGNCRSIITNGRVTALVLDGTKAEASVTVPVSLEGRYELIVEIESAPGDGPFWTHLPAETGWSGRPILFRKLAPGQRNKIYLTMNSIGSGNYEITMLIDDKQMSKGRTTPGYQDMQPYLIGKDQRTIIFSQQEKPVKILSVKIRMLSGVAKVLSARKN